MYDWMGDTTFGPVHWVASVFGRFTGLRLWYLSPSRSIQLVRSCGVLAFLRCGQCFLCSIVNVVAIWILALVEWPDIKLLSRRCRASFYSSLHAF